MTRDEIFKKYVEHANAYVNWKKVDGSNPDEEFMRSIEEKLNVSHPGLIYFREGINIQHQRSIRKALKFTSSMIPGMDEAISQLAVME